MAPPSKRRKLSSTNAIPELIFDDISRAEYLTGFHKRKQARIKKSQELAAKKEREDRVRDRAQVGVLACTESLRAIANCHFIP
jgi:ribosomal RNA-processing protein 17